MQQFKVIPIPAFKDNYIWLIVNTVTNRGIVVDPGDATPVLDKISALKIKLVGILLTHHHHDHCGGVSKILDNQSVSVFGPANENICEVSQPVVENYAIKLDEVSVRFEVLEIPGHTAGHVAYYTNDWLFCGDTLFTAGCGRLFEGTAMQMYKSLSKLANLPNNTSVYCGHEYTLANLRFAQAVEPKNDFIKKRIERCQQLRAINLPTVPGVLAEEKLTNPFLRCHLPEIKRAAEEYFGTKLPTEIEVFACLRQWKNEFI